MQKKELVKTLEKLEEKGILFEVYFRSIGCCHLFPFQIVQYIENPDLFEAQFVGIDLTLLIKYRNYERECSALTKKGRPCRNPTWCLDIKEFARKNGQIYCATHKNHI